MGEYWKLMDKVEYTVDIGSFQISLEEKQLLDSMDADSQRKWLSEQVLNGLVDIDVIYKS